MKYLFTFIILFSFLIVSCSKDAKKTDDMHNSKSADLGDGAYGFVKIDEQNAISVEELFNTAMNNDENLTIKAKGKITKVCQHSGCWVTIEMPNGKDMLVEFKDEFSIPKKGMVGKSIYFQGKTEKEIYSVDELRSNAMKDGKSKEEVEAITEPEIDIKFIAEGVLIK